MEKLWYVVNTYSGHEAKVKEKLEMRAESMGFSDYIFRVIVPEETVVETMKDGSKKEKKHKMFPGYILVEMIMTDEAWYIVRNTRGVTGFVGSGTDPIPLTEDEIRKMGFEISEINVDYDVNDSIEIIDGPFKDYVGVVQEINKEKHKVKVLISMFGRETPVDLELSQVQKVK